MQKQSGGLKMGKQWANRESSDTTHANAPFRDHHLDGHDLNESYKIPTQNPQGRPNHSYMHPLVGGLSHGNAPGFPTAKVTRISPVQTGKGRG